MRVSLEPWGDEPDCSWTETPEWSFNLFRLLHAVSAGGQKSRIHFAHWTMNCTHSHLSPKAQCSHLVWMLFVQRWVALASQQHFFPLFLRSRSLWELMLTVSFSRSRSLSALFWLCFLARSTMWVKAMNICTKRVNVTGHQGLDLLLISRFYL